MEKQLSVAILGCGRMGNTIIEQIEDLPEVKRIVGYDPSDAQLTKTKTSHPQVEVTTDLETVLNDSEIQLVYIAASNANHVPLAVKALRAGKAVMSEKPSGISYEQVEELLQVQKETGGFVQVGLECRYSWAYLEAKKAIQSGEIGQLKNVHFTYSQGAYSKNITLPNGDVIPNWRVFKSGSGSMVLEKLCHYIDLVRWWNEGSKVDKFILTNAENVIPYFEIEDNVHVSYHFDNGCVSHLYFISTAAALDERGGNVDLFDQDKMGYKLNYVLTGTEGAIEIDVFQREIRFYHHTGKPGQEKAAIVRKLSWDKDFGKENGQSESLWFHNTYEQNRDIVRRVLNGLPPSISLEDAQESMRLCLDFAAAAENQSWEVIHR